MLYFILYTLYYIIGFPQWLAGKESTCNAGDTGDKGLIPGSGRSPGGGNGNLFQYSCQENLKDRGIWWVTVHRVSKNKTLWSEWAQLRILYYTTLYYALQFSSVQFSGSVVSDSLWLPWTAAHQASPSITNSQSPPKPMYIESVIPSNQLILCRPLLLPPSIFPSVRAPRSQLLKSGAQSIGVSASISLLFFQWTPRTDLL